ncbi:DUF1990 domain-containing protein [Stieleria sp. TO1_6]|uniref:DUF1990 domain-containing protein n=1 Tax=Stieleria tagensis TaxID=2956795 RepID=UPI00209B6E5F|nr:DUF1990 domain-containing protein [Stieleria tagensis]MCO8121307.1 DUF1990 domain-containing protein [Stieleria tagensis]
MLSIIKPSAATVAKFLARQSKLDFNYPDVGRTSGGFPRGYDYDRFEVELGRGEQCFQAARSAMQSWQHFRVGWVEAVPSTTAIVAGNDIAIRANVMGLWALAACRIIDVIDECSSSDCRFGYSFGTLPAHPEQGEERFQLVRFADDRVRYRVTAFFRPNQLTARLAWSYFRNRFNQFRRQSAAVMIDLAQPSTAQKRASPAA